jgi:bifunctional DNA-binding transcriptional regulator/antitoxin component of YhaV-PrlF toxin-antitoxin module
MSFQSTTKISSKGQITLPKPVQAVLGGNIVRIVVEGDVVRLEPVPDLAGSLKRYATDGISSSEARDLAWTEAVHDKHGRD